MPSDQIDRLFDEHEGDLQYVGDMEPLGNSKAAKVAGLALLLIAARQAGKYDDGPTSDATIRTEVDRHGLLDSSNYTKHVAALKPYVNINGSGRTTNYKLKHDGRQRAKGLASAALGA